MAGLSLPETRRFCKVPADIVSAFLIPPIPIKEIKVADANKAINQVSKTTEPNKMEIYLKGIVTILKEVIAQNPPDKK